MFNVNKKKLSISDNPRLLWSHRFVYALNSWPQEKYVVPRNIRSLGHEKWMLFPQHSISRPRHKDDVTSTKRSCGHDIISTFPRVNMKFHELISRGHDILFTFPWLNMSGHDKTSELKTALRSPLLCAKYREKIPNIELGVGVYMNVFWGKLTVLRGLK